LYSSFISLIHCDSLVVD